jgi:predicted Ser/Thr protein kinase
LNAETVNDVERMLKEVGYSGSAVKEILKWYKLNNIDRKT